MVSPKYNLYKQRNIFRCVHDIHQHFMDEMSPYHILIQRRCYPSGCLYFQWKCRLLAKRKKCFRNFKKVGRECSNCRYFYEEKIYQYPEFVNNDIDFSDYRKSFEDFEIWVDSLRNKRVHVEGTVNFVSPELVIRKINGIPTIRFSGFLIRFQTGYIDNAPFEDPFYLRISALTQQQLAMRQGDELDFRAQLEIDRGRFRFIKSGSFMFYNRGKSAPPQKQDILERIRRSVLHAKQSAVCLSCRNGVLADIHGNTHGPSRALVCLAGIGDPACCLEKIVIDKDELDEICGNPEWKGQTV